LGIGSGLLDFALVEVIAGSGKATQGAAEPTPRPDNTQNCDVPDTEPFHNAPNNGSKIGADVMSDPKLVYSLEIRLLDLEKKVIDLEKQIDGLVAGRKTSAGSGLAPLPAALIKRINDGENPVRAIRQFRLMTQRELGDRSGIRPNHISAIERGMSYGLKTAKRLAEALEVQVDLLLK
jgi:DNA-binding XRE family transcriptional regulator